ncbi:uncharacterized protein [Clytia hemisphaerica]|uniref:Cnidarian restricted protein n=1 Tax=Clytia hemisphaerica TaxID=252671 RepID=A0A7M5UVX9_9CNID
MFIRTFIICYVVYVSFTLGEETIVRTATGDYLNGQDLDCGFYGATAIGNDTCFCGSGKSYFTNSSGSSSCFFGRGQEELGCTVYNMNDPRDQIQILNMSVDTLIDLNSDKGLQCQPTPVVLKEWVNETWVNMEGSNLPVGINSRTVDQPGGGAKVTIKTLHLYPVVDEAKKEYLQGKLVRFDFTVCNHSSCLLLKYPGERTWNAPQPPTEAPTTTTAAPTTTTAVPTTGSGGGGINGTNSTIATPTREPSTGDDNDDEDLLIKILVPVCVIIFIIIFCTILYLCWRHKNSSKSNEHFVGISPVPQPTVKQGHVNRGAIDISNPASSDE